MSETGRERKEAGANDSISSSALSTQSAKAARDEAEADNTVREHVLAQYMRRLSKKRVVTGQDICEILAALGLNDDEAEVRPLLSDWNSVGAEEAVEAVNTVRVSQGVDIQSILKMVEHDVVLLAPLQYMRYKLPCFKKDPSWEYRTVRLDLHVAPRHLLFASTGVVLLLTGMAILILMSLLWLNQANDREQVQMRNFHLLLSSFTQSFEQHFIEAHAETMVDQVDTMAKMIEKQQEFFEDALDQELFEDVSLMASLLNTAGAAVMSRAAAEAEGFMAGIADMFAASAALGLTLSDLVEVVSEMHSSTTTSDAGGVDLSQWETVAVQHGAAREFESVLIESATLECSYGPCEYDAVPCLRFNSQTNQVVTHTSTLDVHRTPILAVAVTIDSLNVTLCASRSVASAHARRDAVLASIVADWNAVLRETYGPHRELLLGARASEGGDGGDGTTSAARWLTPFLRKEHTCFATTSACSGLDHIATDALRSGSAHKRQVVGYSGVLLHAAAAPTQFGLAVVLSLTDESFLEHSRCEIVEILDFLNFNSDRSTELSVARRDPRTGSVIAQVNRFRFVEECFGECERIPPSTIAARRGLETESSGWVISSDYRPQPVLGAYSFVGQGINVVMIIERDIREIRTIGLSALTSIFNDNNEKYSGTLEAQLVRFSGMLPMRTFDRFARCDHIRECITSPKYGVLYRSDCVHCAQAPIPEPDQLEFLTDLKLGCDDGGSRTRNCSRFAFADHRGVLRLPLEERNEASRSTHGLDYRGQEVLAVYSFISNLSVGLIVKLDREEIEGPITQMIGIAVGTAIGIVVVGLVALISFSRKVLDKIEFEWLHYKRRIDEEKQKFDEMVKDVIPRQIRDDLLSGHKQALSLPSLSLIFVDICAMSEKTKSWSPELVCRYLTYTFAVMEEAASHFKLNKVRIFGDTYFGVGGLVEARNAEHSIVRCASFGSVLIQLFSNRFAHYPDRIPIIAKTFEEVVAKHGPAFPDVQGNFDDVGHVLAPHIRLGIHHGMATFCMIETGRTPTFDVFGSSVVLAARMQATSQANKMHLTGAAKEVLERTDRDRLFEFDEPRKTVVKGQGTVTSYFINSANIAIPSNVLASLGIEYSNLRVFYEDGGATGGSPLAPSDHTAAAATRGKPSKSSNNK